MKTRELFKAHFSGRDREALGLGLFAAIHTFLFFARRDHFDVLFWWTRESWLFVTLLWLKDLLLAGVAFLVFAWLVRWTTRLPAIRDEGSLRSRRRHMALLAAILAAGVGLRWIAPQQIPSGLWVDSFIEIHEILRRPGESGWLGGWPRTGEGTIDTGIVSNLYLKFSELLLHVFGRGDWGLLALSAVGGSLALPALYWVVREIAGPRVALVATAIMAFSAWPLIFSRWTWTGTLMLFLVLAACGATLVSLRKQSGAWAFAAGVFGGLMLHTHPAAGAVAGGLAVFALWSLRKPRLRRLAGISAVGALLAFAPLGVAFARFPERLGGRARDAWFLAPASDITIPASGTPLSVPARLFHNAVSYSGLFLWTADPNARHGLPNRPRMHPLIGITALVGAALSWKRARGSGERHVLLLLLAAGALAAGALSNPTGAPNTFRTSALIAPTAIWSATVLTGWTMVAVKRLRVRESFLWSLGLCVLLLVETDRALRVWPDHPVVRRSFFTAEVSAGRMLRNLVRTPTVIDPGALPAPIIVETLAAVPDPRVPVPRMPRMRPEELIVMPPREPFWYLTTRTGLETLQRNGLRCARAVPMDESAAPTVISRVVVATGKEPRA